MEVSKKKSKNISADVKLADERRIKSLDERYKTFQAHKKAIQSCLEGRNSFNKKIKFEDDLEDFEERKKDVLFGESSEESDLEDEKRFHSGKTKELLELRSKTATDPRFKLDDRFYDGEGEEKVKDGEEGDEKKTQMNVLESVLGYQVEVKNRLSYGGPSVVRYDPLNDESKETVAAIPPKEPKKKKKKKEEEGGERKVDESTLKVRFYEVRTDLRESIKTGNSEGFSLLDTFSSEPTAARKCAPMEAPARIPRPLKVPLKKTLINPFKYESSDDEGEVEVERAAQVFERMEPSGKDEGQFLFTNNDPRLMEGVEFAKNGSVSGEIDDNFLAKRRELKNFVKTKIAKQGRRLVKKSGPSTSWSDRRPKPNKFRKRNWKKTKKHFK